MAKANGKKAGAPSARMIEQRWTKPLADTGWTAIPTVILTHQRELRLDALDLAIVIHIAKHWWLPGTLPFPSKGSIAKLLDVDVSTVRRRIARMERRGLIARVARRGPLGGSKTNEYKFDGLISKATPFAIAVINERRERKAKRDHERGRPVLRAVKGGRDEEV